jgi:SAM-dependent methyltransferase
MPEPGWMAGTIGSARNMNSRHSKVTDWGLSQASIGKQDIILDVGCSGGRTVSNLAAIATQGKVYGIDHSTESVAMAVRTNKQWIDVARVEVREASVSRLPFSEGAFDVITAVETHFWWPAFADGSARSFESPEARWQADHHRGSLQGSKAPVS